MPQSYTQRYRFGRHDLIAIGGVDYRHYSSDKTGHQFRRAYEDDIAEFFSHDQIYELIRHKKLTVEKGHFLPLTIDMKTEGRMIDLTTMTPEQQLKVLWKEDWCVLFLKEEAEDRADRSPEQMRATILRLVGVIQQRHDERQGMKKAPRAGRARTGWREPTPDTLKAWLNLYAKYDGRLNALFDLRWSRSGNTDAKVDERSLDLARKAIQGFADDRQPTTANIISDYRVLLADENARLLASDEEPILDEVSERTIQRMILQVASPAMLAARRGKGEAKRLLHPSRGGAPIYRPLQRIELDEVNFDLMLLLKHAGADEYLTPDQRAAFSRSRVWITASIDIGTKAILAIVIHTTAPSAATALRCLEMTVMDKAEIAAALGTRKPWPMHGFFLSCFTDGGSAFVAKESLLGVKALGAEWVGPPTGNPQFRGTIERVFGTVQRQLPRLFSGRTFANVQERGDYDSEGLASLNVEEFARALTLFVVDVYHTTPHEALHWATPLDHWLQMTEQFPVAPPPDMTLRRHMFGLPLSRVIGDEGITVFGVHYQSERLQKLSYQLGQGKAADIKVSHFDLSAISVRHGNAWITVPNALDDIDLAGVGLDEWIAAWRELARLNADRSSLHAAAAVATLKELRAMGDGAIRRTGLASPIMSIEDMDRFERQFFGQLQYRRDRGPNPGPIDFGSAPDRETPQASTAEGNANRWMIKDI